MIIKTADLMLVQLYGHLQPNNAEPLSIASLAAYVTDKLPKIAIEVCIINHAQAAQQIEHLMERIASVGHSIIGLSMPQGTLQLATRILDQLTQTPLRSRPVIVLGHSIPTHLSDELLSRYPELLIIEGWGEEALLQIARSRLHGIGSPEDIAGVRSATNRNSLKSLRRIINNHSDYTVAPIRIPGDFFRRVESSRGCHYGRCTFCTRPPGDPSAWNRLPLDRIAKDIENLKRLGVRDFTFTDEDFFGTNISEALKIGQLVRNHGRMTFTVSVRADNIYTSTMNSQELQLMHGYLRSLRASGLRKAFIGVESLSNAQLRRYGKGVDAAQSITSVKIVQDTGIDVEIGFIPFDPFTTMQDLQENLTALRKSGLWRAVGNVFAKLRIQLGSPMSRTKRLQPLITSLDREMIAYNWHFSDSRVAQIYNLCSDWWSPIEPIYWLTRNIERTTSTPEALSASVHTRKLALEVLTAAVDSVRRGSYAEFRTCLTEANRSHQTMMNDFLATLTKRQGVVPLDLVNQLANAAQVTP